MRAFQFVKSAFNGDESNESRLSEEFVVKCVSCGEIYTGVPENGKVECLYCDKILMQNIEEVSV